jgi:hydroxyethylthiazole kinase-like uncharacterized protein yjeF
MSLSTLSFPRELYLASQVQQLDRLAIDKFGIAGIELMKRAGASCFDAIQQHWPEARRLLVFAGGGNNGGDAYIVAGLAREQGMAVHLLSLSDPENLKGDAREAWQWALEKKVDITAFQDYTHNSESSTNNTVIVDGIFGTGLDRAVEGIYAQAIEHINNSSCPVLAIDIPSGLNANTGMPMGRAVVADCTVSFIGMKRGMLTGVAGNHVGRLWFADLDIPQEVYSDDDAPQADAIRIDIHSAAKHLGGRMPASHKGDFGHVLVIGGDHGFGGAILLAAEASLRTGAGLVSVITRSAHRAGILARRPELMVLGTEDEGADLEALVNKATVIVVGPGLGTGEWSRTQLQRALGAQLSRGVPLIVDADGLTLIAERSTDKTQIKRDNWILTPHPGEAARLLQCDTAEVSKDRYAAVRSLQQRWGGNCLLKGHGSLIATAGEAGEKESLFLCSEGNPGMASGGMGDVLTGVIAGLVAQGFSLGRALRGGVCIHGEAADLAAESGQRGTIATDLLPFIRQLVNANQAN